MKFPVITLLTYFSLVGAYDRSTDSLALLDLKNANPQARLKFDPTKEITRWDGVKVRGERVTEISFSECNINLLPESITNLSALTTVDLSKNDLKELPISVGNWSSLKQINFSHNDIRIISQNWAELSQIHSFDLSYNTIYGAITLPSATSINLKENQITEFQFVKNEVTTTKLDVSNNRLTNLSAISRLKRLQTLDCSGNLLRRIPDLRGVPIKSIDFSNNSITTIPLELGVVTTLRSLDLRGNLIATIPAEILNPGIETLQIGYNVLNRETVSQYTKVWLDILCPDWYRTQGMTYDNRK